MHRRQSSMVDNTKVPHRRRTPSFSSILLDAIYRSIDGNEPTLCHHGEKTSANPVKKQSTGAPMEGGRKASSLKRAIDHRSAVHFNSTSSSSDSSNGGVFSSSSEAESGYREKSRRSKPVKYYKCRRPDDDEEREKAKGEIGGGLTKTKLKALKIYGELKKVKQPISPGGRITSFLNSIFNANAKKVKMCSNCVSGDVEFHRKSKSTASSPSSFSRPCLSETPSSSGNNNKYSNGLKGIKRSVKFCPVNVIFDEDCRPCGHKCIYEEDPRLMSSTVQKNLKVSSRTEELKKKESAVSSKAIDYVTSYQRRGIRKMDLRGFIEEYDDEDEEDDALSYSSSDLFELDHLIRIGRYREELPVFETTRLKSNEAIVNGFVL
ncbi:BREVIS RADIX-like 4 isoform 1 [Hibiscus syriacus]|uniref:BREVIS RADIX-like 4 isoform 1 n=2 Tax=Hibiscus syriacus TaxID=106335 RepID=A0A6A2XXC3_HIBSY|nr:BREVIS RADIX-like 4 isoform 1 [Hibiscus syriacus]